MYWPKDAIKLQGCFPGKQRELSRAVHVRDFSSGAGNPWELTPGAEGKELQLGRHLQRRNVSPGAPEWAGERTWGDPGWAWGTRVEYETGMECSPGATWPVGRGNEGATSQGGRMGARRCNRGQLTCPGEA